MPFVNLVGYRPSPRYDALAWDRARFEEGPDGPTPPAGAGADLGTQVLNPLDADPAKPQARNFTILNASAPPRWYRVIFFRQGEAGVEDASGWDYYAPGAEGYPNTVELVSQSSVAELVDLTLEQQDALRAIAISDVEQFTGQVFQPRTGTQIEDGTNGEELHVTERIASLTAVQVKGTSLALTDLEIAPDGDRLYFKAPVGPSYYLSAMASASDDAVDSRTFRAGPGTVILTGVFGWEECPEPVVQAIRIQMETQARADASQLATVVSQARRLGLQSISQGNLRAQVGNPALVAPEAARLLGPYVWHGRGGVLL